MANNDPGALSSSVAQLSTTSGLGSYSLGKSIKDKLTFVSAGYISGDIVRYNVTDTSGQQENVQGIFTTPPDQLTRDTLLLSSTGSFIDWPLSGQRIVTPLVSSNIFVVSFSVGGKFSDMIPDEWDLNYEIFDVVVPMIVTFPLDFLGSSIPGCETAPSTDVTLTFQSITAGVPTTVGTLVIPSGMTTGTLSLPFPVVLPVNSRLRLYAPADVDTNIVGVYGTVVGTRS